MSEGKGASSRARLSAAKQVLLQQRLRGKKSGIKAPVTTIPVRTDPAPAPLSFAQQRLWFLAQLEPESSAYHLPLAFHIQGPLHADALAQSLAEIVRRHEILRSTYPIAGGEPVQHVAPASFNLSRTDLRNYSLAEAEVESQRLFAAETKCHFNLHEGPLFRAQLLHLGPSRHVLLLTFHHILFDEWSFDVFCGELSELYDGFARQQPPSLPPLPIQYGDFAVWQRRAMQGEALEREKRYWRRQLAGAPHAVDLPLDRPRHITQTARGARHELHLSEALVAALKTLSLREGTTLFMTLLATFKVLLYRYSNQVDLVVGTPITNRSRTETEPLIGLFLNMIALRTDLTGGPSFRSLLAQVREVALDGYSHQDLPFEQLVEELQIERDLTRAPLVQVLFILQSTSLAALELPGLSIEQSQFGSRSAAYDLTLFLYEETGGLLGAMEYNPDLFDAETIARMVGHWRILLEAAVADPDESIASLPMLSEAERRQQLLDWNDTTTAYPDEGSLMERLSAQAERTPAATAFQLPDGGALDYQTLNRRANQLAHYLHSVGVRPGTRVGLCMERSFEAVIGLVGILKAGGVYVPLDPTYPEERLAFMLQDAQVAVVLTQTQTRRVLPEAQVGIMHLTVDTARTEQQPITDPSVVTTAQDLAYIIYTSGSTGQPKGVAIAHRQILNRLMWMWANYRFATGEVNCQKTALSFVDSLWELLGPLLQGSPTLIVPDDTVRDPAKLVETLGAHGVTRLWLVPSLLRLMLDTCSNIRERLPKLDFWVSSGEPLAAELLERFREAMPRAALYNLYGTSEAWDVTWFEPGAGPHPGTNVPIGRPIANTYTYILNEALQPTPPGAVGELYVSGVGVAEGYLNQPELTAEVFRSNPFPRPPNSAGRAARLYRTGDLARYRADGRMEFIGRVDHQVKLRGFRIELGEIESRLNDHPDLRQAIVLARENPTGDRRLVAYFVPESDSVPTPGELKDFLNRALPAYMVPAMYVHLDALPLTPSGKIDRDRLPAVGLDSLARDRELVLPEGRYETQLTAIWRDLLGLDRVGALDNFFDIGGHSMLAVDLFSRIEQAFQRSLPLSVLYRAGTIRDLAREIESKAVPEAWSCIVPIRPEGDRRPLFLVHGVAGNVIFFRHLADRLGAGLPVYAIQPETVDGRLPPERTIEAMASHYVAELKRVQPAGPYRLGGFSFGGLVAYEMTQQLLREGERVDLLLVFDTRIGAPDVQTDPRQAGSTKLTAKHFEKRPLRRFLRQMKRKALWGDRNRAVLRGLVNAGLGRRVPVGARPDFTAWYCSRLVTSYRIKPCECRVVFFSTQPRNESEILGYWRRLALRGIDVHRVPGKHKEGLFEEPNVIDVARLVDNHLLRSETSTIPAKHSPTSSGTSDTN